MLGVSIDSMDLWEFKQALAGYAEANGQKPRGGTIDDERLADMGIAGF